MEKQKVIKKEDIVGTYQRVDILSCKSCGREKVVVCKILRADEGWMGSLSNQESWSCPHCEDEEPPSSNYGKRFVCPDCSKENLLVMEPYKIDHHNGDRFVCFYSEEVICMHCDSEFGVATIIDSVDDLSDPTLWKDILYRKGDSHAEVG